jgi:integrase
MIKLNKYQTNQILNTIQKDNKIYGLILKLTYTYARNIGEVSELKTKDINLKENTITFTIYNNNRRPKTFPLTDENIIQQLKIITEDKNTEEYIFDEYIPHKKIKATINYYIYKKNIPLLKGNGLTTQDFRILRGQHLYQDGISINTIQELYQHADPMTTKKLIEYYDLKEKEITVDEIFNDKYTNLNLYKDDDYEDYQTYYCVYEGKEAVIEKENNNIFINGDVLIKDKLMRINLKRVLDALINSGEYSVIDGVCVLKN